MKRFEQKYLLDSVNINNVLKQINAKPVYNSRWINSIYYDTKNLILYNESVEGTVPRKKIRFCLLKFEMLMLAMNFQQVLQ